jgi:hypothetical protein
MIKTSFLTKEDYGFKSFKPIDPGYYKHEKFDNFKLKIVKEIPQKTGRIARFSIEKGGIVLPKPNEIYFVEHLPYNSDLILPRDIQLNDWVVISFESIDVALSISAEKITKIKIRGNGRRIMGLDEHLVCDMPFHSLRLTFLGDVDGWVVT